MFQDIISVDIGNKFIKIITGKKNNITTFESIPTPDNSLLDNRIIDIDAIYNTLNKYFTDRHIGLKDIAFTLHGSDIIIRHIDIPLMSTDKVGETAIWEISQYLPDLGIHYYIDYEILSKVATKEQKLYKVMVVAVPRTKVDRFVELSKLLHLNLKVIDIAANLTAKVFRSLYQKNKKMESIGIIDIGSKSSTAVILDKGNLYIEREISFGISNILEDIALEKAVDSEEAFAYLTNKFDFKDTNLKEDMNKSVRNTLDNIMDAFDKVIKFYNSGKLDKKLDYIYVIGAGSKIKGIEGYIKEITTTETKVLKSGRDIKASIRSGKDFQLNLYVNSYGVLLRDNPNNLNILPDEMKKTKSSQIMTRKIIFGAISLAAILIISAVVTYSYYLNLSLTNSDMDKKISMNKTVRDTNKELNKEESLYTSYVDKVDLLTKNKKILSQKIMDLQKYVPQDVVFSSITYANSDYSITAHTKNYNSVTIMSASLQMSTEYKNTSIKNVTTDKDGYTFTLNIRSD
ncbi:MAG TPA: pilus assembly protein PilM [Clostridiaceae bacterium]